MLIGISLEPYSFELPLKIDGRTVLKQHHMLLPHELYAHMFSYNRGHFNAMFRAEEFIIQFWECIEESQESWWLNHPMRDRVLSQPGKFCPLRKWTDEVALNKERNRTAMILLWGQPDTSI